LVRKKLLTLFLRGKKAAKSICDQELFKTKREAFLTERRALSAKEHAIIKARVIVSGRDQPSAEEMRFLAKIGEFRRK